jgi:hypothetical protein
MSTPSPTAVLSDLASGWADSMQTSMRDALQWWGVGDQHDHQHDHQHGRGCRCGTDHRCECGDPCSCCVPKADVVLHARVGERRVLAFAVRNPRRREREVTLEVGPWHRCADETVQISAAFDVDSPLTLAGCEKRVVRLLVGISGEPDDKEQGRLGDVEACASAYADVRFEGSARPLRVAVVEHTAPRDAVDVTCDCGCC